MSAGGVLAVVPARKGSEGLAGKNVRDLAGRPLVAHTIQAALDCPHVERVIVTSDDERIEAITAGLGAEFIHRPAALATAAAQSEDVVRHVLDTLDPEAPGESVLALLQPTSPLRTAEHLTASIEAFRDSPGLRSVISVTEEPHSPYKAFRLEAGLLVPLFDRDRLSAPRQSLPEVYRQNGAIYLFRSGDFLEAGSFYLPPAHPFEMTPEESVDIDTEADFRLAEHYLSRSRGSD